MMSRAGGEKVAGIRMTAPVAGGELIERADIVALNEDGYLVKAAQKEGLRVVGIATDRVDNRMGSDGDETAGFKSGGFVFNQEGFKNTDLMKTAYIKNACTVTSTSVSSSAVGTVIEVDAACATVLINP